jgi:hypothetical protein
MMVANITMEQIRKENQRQKGRIAEVIAEFDHDHNLWVFTAIVEVDGMQGFSACFVRLDEFLTFELSMDGAPIYDKETKTPQFVVIKHASQKFKDDERQTPTRKPAGIPIELADCIIRILHFSGKHGIDIAEAVREKMEYNETRPFKHGNKAL